MSIKRLMTDAAQEPPDGQEREAHAQSGPHEFASLKRWWSRGRCRHCFVPRVDHPVRGWVEARALGDKRLPDYGGPWTDHVSTSDFSGTGWMP